MVDDDFDIDIDFGDSDLDISSMDSVEGVGSNLEKCVVVIGVVVFVD